MWQSLAIPAACLAAMFALPSAESSTSTITEGRSAQEFVIDGGHSSVLYRIKHLSASPFWGRFNEVSGSLRVDDDKLDESFIRVEVPTASVDSNDENRDKHLRSQDFFAAKEFPKLTFESSKIEKTGDDTYRVTGDLTLRGKSKELTFEAKHTGTAKVMDRFGLRCGYEATLEFDRTEFGITYGAKGGVLGETVRVVIAIEGKLPK